MADIHHLVGDECNCTTCIEDQWQYTEEPTIRQFATGATRDTENDKLDFEGFFSPLVLRTRAEYMHRHRLQKDGELRSADNWQKGMPKDVYMKSLWRHFHDLWMLHRGEYSADVLDIRDVICAVMFNAEGYLYEVLKERE